MNIRESQTFVEHTHTHNTEQRCHCGDSIRMDFVIRTDTYFQMERLIVFPMFLVSAESIGPVLGLILCVALECNKIKMQKYIRRERWQYAKRQMALGVSTNRHIWFCH